MNYIWSGMIIISILYAAVTGNMQNLSEEILNSSQEAVNLCIYMAGVVGLWTGMMKAAEEIGFLDRLEKILVPVIRFLFPDMKDQKTKKFIAVNMASNILGLGWAATPSGLKAMKCLQKWNGHKKTASMEMCPCSAMRESHSCSIPLRVVIFSLTTS